MRKLPPYTPPPTQSPHELWEVNRREIEYYEQADRAKSFAAEQQRTTAIISFTGGLILGAIIMRLMKKHEKAN